MLLGRVRWKERWLRYLPLWEPPVLVTATTIYQIDEDYSCPCCSQVMPFLMELDSEIPFVLPNTENLGAMEWGSGGIAYFFWCDACRISAGRWQCT